MAAKEKEEDCSRSLSADKYTWEDALDDTLKEFKSRDSVKFHFLSVLEPTKLEDLTKEVRSVAEKYLWLKEKMGGSENSALVQTFLSQYQAEVIREGLNYPLFDVSIETMGNTHYVDVRRKNSDFMDPRELMTINDVFWARGVVCTSIIVQVIILVIHTISLEKPIIEDSGMQKVAEDLEATLKEPSSEKLLKMIETLHKAYLMSESQSAESADIEC